MLNTWYKQWIDNLLCVDFVCSYPSLSDKTPTYQRLVEGSDHDDLVRVRQTKLLC